MVYPHHSQYGGGDYQSVYEFIAFDFSTVAKSGFFNEVVQNMEQSEGPNPFPFGAYRRTKILRAKRTISIPNLYNKKLQGRDGALPCPLIAGYYMSFMFKKGGGEDGDVVDEMILELVSVPALKRNDGSFVINSAAKWDFKVGVLSSQVFLKANNLTVFEKERSFPTRSGSGEGRDGDEKMFNTTQITFDIPVSSTFYDCTEKYVQDTCRNFTATPQGALCTEWNTKCNVTTVLPLPAKLTNVNQSHMLVIPSKTHGGDMQSEPRRQESLRRDRAVYDSRRDAVRLADMKVSELAHSMQLSETAYVPQIENDQNFLTFIVIILVFLSEWVLSIPFFTDLLVHRVLKRSLGKNSSADIEARDVLPYRKMKKVFKRRFIWSLPALAGYVPLALGLHNALRRKNAVVGLLASGWATKMYQAFLSGLRGFDSDEYTNGVLISFTVVYKEFSLFESLFKEYLVATSIATVLLAYSLIALLMQGIVLFKASRRMVRSTGDNLQPQQEGKACDDYVVLEFAT